MSSKPVADMGAETPKVDGVEITGPNLDGIPAVKPDNSTEEAPEIPDE